MTLEHLNGLDPASAEVEFTKCCGAHKWAESMVAARPFTSPASMLDRAESIWRGLKQDDWLEVFEHHAKIGDVTSLKEKFANTKNWSKGEQSGMQGADAQVIEGLASGNIAYEGKFGFIFLICATGKSAKEMLAALSKRLDNDRETEIKNVVEEQNKITKLRLEKLLGD